MRIRALVVSALLAFPVGLTAQVLRAPRRGTTPEPAPLPPAAEPVARALSLQRSRWSAQGYTMFSAFQVPDGSGGTSQFTTFGTGTHADYFITQAFAATVDLTASFGGQSNSQTAEVGTRYSPFAWDSRIRPFADVRATYMRLSDSYSALNSGSGLGAGQNLNEGTRYSRGFGGIAGAGADFTVTPSWAITTEFLAMRHDMSMYRRTTTANLPVATNYMMNSFRFTLGLRFSPVRTSSLTQNPRS